MISSDDFSPFITSCVHQFQIPKNSNYDYQIATINNNLDTAIFAINQTNNCLSIKQLAGINKNSILGLHQMNITIKDNSDNVRRTEMCNIYITQSCTEKVHIYSLNNLQNVTSDINYYIELINLKSIEILRLIFKVFTNTGIFQCLLQACYPEA